MTAEDYDELLIEEKDGVALVKLNRPHKLNSWGGHMNEQLNRYLLSLNRGDYRVRAVILTGEGRAFSAGGDVSTFPAANPDARSAPWRPVQHQQF